MDGPVLVLGGTGFIGRHLVKSLLQDGTDVAVVSRTPDAVRTVFGEDVRAVSLQTVGDVAAIVNLAGESIAGGRWTPERKRRILDSRIKTSDHVYQYIRDRATRPVVLVNASAIGYYGTSETAVFTEASQPMAKDFLADVTRQWEHAAAQVESLGVRTVYTRFGVVLGRDEGALVQMALPYRLHIGGPIGTGRQWISWVHIADAVGLIRHALHAEDVHGPLNVTAPNPVTNDEFGRHIGSVLRRAHYMPTPAFALRAALGEMADLVLQGQRVLPEKALATGYVYQYEKAGDALRDLLG